MSTIEASLQLEIAQYQNALKKAQGDVERFRQRAQKTGDKLGGALFGGLAKRAAMLAPILGAGFGAKGILDAVVNMERLEKMMTSTEGSAVGAKNRMEELREVARLPGLDFEQAVQGDVRLRAVGLSADLSKAAIMQFGNALALVGGSSSDLDGVFLALSQIAAKGNVFAEEINQIAERVPQVRAIMKDAFGTADTEAIQAMGLSTEEFIGRMVSVMEQMDRASRGLTDEFSEMRDIGKTLLNDIGAPVVNTLIPAFTDLLEMLKENRAELIGLGEAMGEVAKGAVKVGGFGIKNGGALTKSVLQPGMLGLDILGNVANAYGIGGRKKQTPGEFVGPPEPTAAQREATAGALPPIVKPDSGAESAVRAVKRALAEEARLREQIAEIQRKARLENLTAAEKEVAIQQEIYRLATTFGQAGPETETARLEVEKRILELKRDQAAAAKQAAEEAKDEQDRAQDQAQRLALFQRELDIAEARAAGENDLADTMQRELDIQQLQARLMEEMALSQDEALMLAERQVEAAAALNAERDKTGRYDAEGRRADGRRQIKGYSQAQGGGEDARARAQGRVDEARSSREIPSGLDAFAAQKGLRDRMGTGAMFPGLTAAFGEPGAGPLAETAAMNAAASDKAGNGGARSLEDKLDRLIAISEQGLLGDG